MYKILLTNTTLLLHSKKTKVGRKKKKPQISKQRAEAFWKKNSHTERDGRKA